MIATLTDKARKSRKSALDEIALRNATPPPNPSEAPESPIIRSTRRRPTLRLVSTNYMIPEQRLAA